ncbi:MULTISPECIES: hypothetical protein [unclassified Lentimonas]|uniref:hypothetical protein n=1 Tax=unclassified Lentimonas TaxID=2630993 RepID=UPI001320598F|nr:MULTISPECIES: hypothetical protein [unclassified Lentimonas]CAA6676956.1 Unannotated [Lentimonas sp. CC4]CAA6686762.1 Unannotated [Lentimonas sp. CC6]CAA6692828.1 Unannotated [Lentimonas sp. CC10]CAA6695544.1 Unannotated [Lentimonas sp. CC19]CAA7069875.1 Unannotated [Lentimonas sp. CC11]
MNNLMLYTYALYALATIAMTVWVAQTLYRAGHIFLRHTFHGDQEMAGAVNHLLRVGFYLVNLGFVLMFLKYGHHPETVVGAVEYLTTKVGIVLIVLGAMHFFNMFNFDKMRKKARPPALKA